MFWGVINMVVLGKRFGKTEAHWGLGGRRSPHLILTLLPWLLPTYSAAALLFFLFPA